MRALARRIPPRAPVRLVAGYLWVVVVVNGGAWLARILPALTSGGQPAYLRGTGMTTNIVFVQDLALWLPLTAVAAAWLWARTPRGYLLGAASVVMGVIESIGIAVDQWHGHVADPGSAVASAALAPVFAGVALIGLTAAWLLLRGLAPASRRAREPAPKAHQAHSS